jgi:hypothetical protein
MQPHHKLIVFGFVAFMVAALAYVFVFADLSFVSQPVQVDGALINPPPPPPPAPAP